MAGRTLNQFTPQVARIISNVDKTHSGQLLVWLTESGTDPDDPKNHIWVKCNTPFYGQTQNTNPNAKQSAKDTPSSFGMFMIPQPGNYVKVEFMNGKMDQGYWSGCLVKDVGQTKSIGTPGTPEKHPYSGTQATDGPARAIDPTFAKNQTTSGIGNDPVRGEGSASLHRDAAPECFPIVTPGGHQIILDDKAGCSMIRFRTKGGAQIILDDNSGFIYFMAKGGAAWVELTPEGNVDIYAALSVNIHGEKNINLVAEEDIKIKCKTLSVDADQTIDIRGKTDVKITGNTATLSSATTVQLSSAEKTNISCNALEINTQGKGGKTDAPIVLSGTPYNMVVANPKLPVRAPTHEPSSTHTTSGNY